MEGDDVGGTERGWGGGGFVVLSGFLVLGELEPPDQI